MAAFLFSRFDKIEIDILFHILEKWSRIVGHVFYPQFVVGGVHTMTQKISTGRTQEDTLTFRLNSLDKIRFKDACRDDVNPPRYNCANVLRLFVRAYVEEPRMFDGFLEQYRRKFHVRF
jgi:hypothetical protein